MTSVAVDAVVAAPRDVTSQAPTDPAPADHQQSTGGSTAPEYAHLQPVWRRFTAPDTGEEERASLRDELALGYQPLVENLAGRYTRAHRDSHADLVQIGSIGLLKAIDNVAPERVNGDVLAYLIPCVRGEMQRYFRDRTWMMRTPRRLKDLSVAINRELPGLNQRLGRAPRPSELADALDVDVNEVVDALAARDDQHPGSLDAERPGDERTVSETVGDVEPAYDTIDNREAVRPLIEALPARERTILTLRFFGDLTQSQIAQQLGISQMHVSRLLARTLGDLRRALAEAGSLPAGPATGS